MSGSVAPELSTLVCGHTSAMPAASRSVLACVMPTKRLRPRMAMADVFALSMAAEMAGNRAPIRMPRMPITTSSSTSVNPSGFFFMFMLWTP